MAKADPSNPFEVRKAVVSPPGESATFIKRTTKTKLDGNIGCLKYDFQPSQA
jgi:hypothetical protein